MKLTPSKSQRPLSLRVNFSWILAGKIVFAACKWAVLITLARLVTPDLVGHYVLGLAITNPVILLTNLSLRAVLATDTDSDRPFKDFLSLRFVTVGVALTAIAIFLFAVRFPFEKALVVFMVGVTKCVEALSDVLYGLFQKQERMDRIGQSFVFRGIGLVLAMLAGILLTGEVYWGLSFVAMAWLIVLFAYDLPQALRLAPGTGLRPDWSLERMRDLTQLAFPLSVVAVLLALNQSIPRIVLETYVGEAELGIFAAIAYLLVPGGMIANSIGQASIPQLSRHWAKENWRDFRRMLLRIVSFSAILGLAGVLTALTIDEWLLDFLYGPQYAAASGVFTLIMVAGIFFYVGTALGCSIAATRQFARFIPPYAAWAGVTVALSLLLIPAYGLMGAAWATVGISIVGCIVPTFVLMTARKSR